MKWEANSTRAIEVKLQLDMEEANILRALMQNPWHEEESTAERQLREGIFAAIDSQANRI